MQIQDGHLSGERVVVAKTDLLRGHRVVLVDHRYGAVVEQLLERVLRVEVLRPADQVVLCKQHLRARLQHNEQARSALIHALELH